MSYIPQERREYIDGLTLKEIIIYKVREFTLIELNYIISKILWAYFEVYRSSTSIHIILGVLEAVKLEFYHRKAEPYQFRERIKNGDL